MNTTHSNDEPAPLTPEPGNNNSKLDSTESADRRQRSSRQRHSGWQNTEGYRSKQEHTFETIAASPLLKIAGILLFIAGIAWLLYKSGFLVYINQLAAKLLGGGGGQNAVVTGGDDITALLHLLPGILVLGIACMNKYVFKGKPWLTTTSFYAGTGMLYLTYMVDLLYNIYYKGVMPYSTIQISVGVILVIAASVMYFTFVTHKSRVHFATILFIYFAAIILITRNGPNNLSLFAMIIIFTALLYFFSGKTLGSIVNATNAYFAAGYFLLYFLRRLVLQDNSDLIGLYAGSTTALYLAVLLIHILKPYEGKKFHIKYYNDAVIFVITALTLGTILVIFHKYGLTNFQWIFAAILTILSYALLWLKKGINPGPATEPYYFATILVGASILPLLVQHNMFVLYISMMTMLLTFLSLYRKNQFAALLAVGLLSLAMAIFVFRAVAHYYPALYIESKSLPVKPFLEGLILSVAVVLAAYFLKKLFYRVSFTYSRKWFSKSGTGKYISGIYYTAMYLSAFWLFQYLFFFAFNVHAANVVSWCIFHMGFLIALQLVVVSRDSWIHRPILYISAISLAILPAVFILFVTILRRQALSIGGESLGAFYFHFLGAPLMVMLALITAYNFNKIRSRKKQQPAWVALSIVGLFVFLLLAEYDNITVIMGAGTLEADILKANHHLPFSIIFYLTSLVIMVFSFDRNNKFLGQLSLGLLLLTTIKLFAYDFRSLSATGQAFSFWLSGGFFILYSFLYLRLHKIMFEPSGSDKSMKTKQREDKVKRGAEKLKTKN